MTRRVLTAAAALGAFGAASGQAQVERIQLGQSRAGAPIDVYALGPAEADGLGRGRDDRPALLVVAGVQGHHLVGVEVARALVDRLGAEHADLLATRTVYVVPQLNPDGAAWLRGTPAIESGRTDHPHDADRDGRINEDGPDDVNGDGLITRMRVAHPAPGSGLEAAWVIDADEPRLLRPPDDDETPTHALLIEGIDNDGDGLFNEDGPGGRAGGGVDLDMHFPTHWPEHADGAGRFPLDEPEARALVDWMLTRDNIVAVLVFGPGDTLAHTPPTDRFDASGRMPLGIEQGDAALHERVAALYEDTTGITDGPEASRAGSLVTYAYADFAAWSFQTPVWVRPDGAADDARPAADGDEPGTAAPAPGDERAGLLERGVDPMFVELLLATEDERAAMLAEFEALPEDEQAQRAQLLLAQPDDVQRRVMAIVQGNPQAVDSASADGPAGGGTGSKADADERAWLAHADAVGRGFVAWQAVEHPQLGTVEVGGFVPGFRVNPPAEAIGGLVDDQAAFIAGLLGLFAELDVEAPRVEAVGPGLYRLSLRLANRGTLPTLPAIAEKARRIPGIVAAVSVGVDEIVSGSRFARVPTIDGGGHADVEWLIRGQPGRAVEIEIRSPRYGDRVVRVVLE